MIDSGFRNEWIVVINNTSNKPIAIIKEDELESSHIEDLKKEYTVYPYEKAICQAILIDSIDTEIEEMDYEDLKQIKSMRGMGKLGSSGK